MVVESHAKQAGGGPMYWSQLSDHLIRRGHEVTILSGIPPEGEFASPNTIGLLPVRSNLRSRSIATLMSRYAFKRQYVSAVCSFASMWQPDIIHTVPPIASEAALHAGNKVGVPVVVSVLSHIEAQWSQVEVGRVRSRLFRYLESRALRKPFTRIICLTHRSEQVLAAEGVLADRIVYVPHAVDITRFHADVASIFRNQLGLSKESFVIGYAGALTQEKGFDQLLGAIHRLSDVRDLHLLVAGEISLHPKWKEFVNQSKLRRVHFLGHLEHNQMPGFMASLDLFIIPSLTETLPTTLLEALATGTPVLASAVGGVSEFLQSEWGVTLETPETSNIVDALEIWRMRRTELQRMGKRGQEYVREHHNWTNTSVLTEGVYQSCLKNQ
ncbi:MAG: glycosyltransferase family 4 protein [Promethearchaeota archaeon]